MEYERSVIAVMLNNPNEAIKHNISDDDFTDSFLASVFVAIKSLLSENIAPDLLLISKKIGTNDALSNLAELKLNAVGVLHNMPSYVKRFKSLAETERLKAQLIASLDDLNHEKEPADVIGSLISTLSDFKNKDVDHAYGSKQMLVKTIAHIDAAYDLKCAGKMAGITSGMKKLDKELGGFHNSDFVVVGARPAMGKTAFMLSCAANASKAGFKVGIISTEMSVTQLGVRLLSLSSSVSASSMRDSEYTDDDWARITSGTAKINELPLFVFDKPSCKVSDISIQARAWKSEHGLDILFIDYLTRLKPEEGSENRAIAMGNIATDLKTLARTMDIPVVTLAQLSRDIEKRPSKVPAMGDLRDSGVIEQEADQVLMLYRDSVYNPQECGSDDGANVIIVKNRHGPTSFLDMRFKTKTMEWCDEEGFNDYEYS